MIKEIKVEVPPSSPACTKPPVVGSTVYLMDCVEGMKRYPDKWFDLAVVDPPYGIGESMKKRENTTSKNGINNRHRLNISMSCLDALKIKLFGVQIILLAGCLMIVAAG